MQQVPMVLAKLSVCCVIISFTDHLVYFSLIPAKDTLLHHTIKPHLALIEMLQMQKAYLKVLDRHHQKVIAANPQVYLDEEARYDNIDYPCMENDTV